MGFILSYYVLFYYVLLYWYLFKAYFYLMKNRKKMDLDDSVGGQELGGVEGWKTKIRIYCVKE